MSVNNAGVYLTRGTVQAKDVDIVGSLMNNIQTINGTNGSLNILDGSHIYILCKGTGTYTVKLPSIAAVGNIILVLILAKTSAPPTVNIIPNGLDLGIVFPSGSVSVGVGMSTIGTSITLMSDSTQNVWFVLGSN